MAEALAFEGSMCKRGVKAQSFGSWKLLVSMNYYPSFFVSIFAQNPSVLLGFIRTASPTRASDGHVFDKYDTFGSMLS